MFYVSDNLKRKSNWLAILKFIFNFVKVNIKSYNILIIPISTYLKMLIVNFNINTVLKLNYLLIRLMFFNNNNRLMF